MRRNRAPGLLKVEATPACRSQPWLLVATLLLTSMLIVGSEQARRWRSGDPDFDGWYRGHDTAQQLA